MDGGNDFIATELLKELKEENARKDRQIERQQKNSMIKSVIHAIVDLLIIAAFLMYLAQYDYIGYGTTTYNAEGTYAIIDSDGNVIGYDISDEELRNILEVLDLGEGNSTQGIDESEGAE